jgi:predicted transposase YbfD/YdcC
MEYNASLEIVLPQEAIAIEVNSLYTHFCTLSDQRCRRGIRYPLPIALTMIVLAKLGGEDGPRGMAEWLSNRIEFLVEHLQLPRSSVPHPVTISRILGKAIEVEELENMVAAYFQSCPEAEQSVVISMDGKTIRSTISYGQTQGVHLLALYLPAEGLVLMQMEVDRKENEIVVAPRILEMVDLQGKVVVGDALHTQRELSAQIVEAGGEYCWTVKDNQPSLRQAIARFFEPEICTPGFGLSITDLQSASRSNKGHGRTERRTLTTAGVCEGELDWPHARQVFKVERRFIHHRTGEISQETAFGITSLSPDKAEPAHILALNRDYWGIENGLHYRRDVTFKEDRTRVKMGQAPHVMAILNNLVLGLIARSGARYAPQARRKFAAKPELALDLLFRSVC